MDKYPPWLLYLENAVSEEILFRGIIISFLALIWPTNVILLIIVSALIYGLAHFIIFRWQMVLGAFILGLILGFMFIFIFGITCSTTPDIFEGMRSIFYALFVCTCIHYLVGFLAYKLKFTERYERK